MDIREFIDEWIATSNRYDTKKYLSFYWREATLDDPSVGRRFIGHEGIKDYFDSYFIGYKTQTELVNLIIHDDSHAHLEVVFTGEFPEGNIGGTFEFTFSNGKIFFVKADLIH